MDVGLIITRLKTLVPDLGERVSGAAGWTRLTESGAEPSVTPVAFVLPTAGVGAPHEGHIGAYVQRVELQFTVVLMLRTDAAGLRQLDRVQDLINSIISAIAGWNAGLFGLFTFRRWNMIQAAKGVLAYEIHFAVTDRIAKEIP